MNDFIRVAAAVPRVRPADVAGNVASILRLLGESARKGVDLVVFPELAITGYTCGDLFYRPDLLENSLAGLRKLAKASAKPGCPAFAVGLPVRVSGRIFNCAAFVAGGRVVGFVPKTYLPTTHEFYEARWFASALDATECEIDGIPFGNDLVFTLLNGAVVGIELCEDMWSANPPSTTLALGGANVILNLSASNELVGKTEYRRSLVAGQSARCIAAYVYAGAGVGESTTDLVFGGHTLVAENGTLLAEGERFVRGETLTIADVDVSYLDFERSGNYAFRVAAANADPVRVAEAPVRAAKPRAVLMRAVDPHPFVPDEEADRDARCEEILAIQSTGLATRLEAIGCRNVVLGLSGGLDSALALLVCIEAFDRLGLDRKGIHVFTMPGFGTSKRTRGNAELLAEGFGIPLETIDIAATTRRHLADIGRDESVHDITYENAQARGRTYILMDEANKHDAIVVGTGDLSELALGWCTFNGDHMSMYGVNAGVPKTLVRYIVKRYATSGCRSSRGAAKIAKALLDILATPVSPELLPAGKDGRISQRTEDKVGPYELHDFFLYHFVRRGASKEKMSLLASIAFRGVYSKTVVDKWLDVFLRRFSTQQFKRNSMPDGPKVGSLNLSPRGDWRMPSDAKPSSVK